MSVYTTVNASSKHILYEEDIAGFILLMALPEQYSAHMAVFFTEVPVAEIAEFIHKYNISVKTLKEYYYKHMEPVHKNRELEEYLTYA